jgi:hypothetical protein
VGSRERGGTLRVMFRRRRSDPAGPDRGLDDVTAVLLDDDLLPARDAALRRLTRIAAEAVILQDEAEALLRRIRDREPLHELAPRGGRLTSRFCSLNAELPTSRDPLVRRYTGALREVFDHHAMLLSASLDLLAVAARSERLDELVDRIDGLGRPGRRLEDIRMDLLVEPRGLSAD